jgi:hypothetical protein
MMDDIISQFPDEFSCCSDESCVWIHFNKFVPSSFQLQFPGCLPKGSKV